MPTWNPFEAFQTTPEGVYYAPVTQINEKSH